MKKKRSLIRTVLPPILSALAFTPAAFAHEGGNGSHGGDPFLIAKAEIRGFLEKEVKEELRKTIEWAVSNPPDDGQRAIVEDIVGLYRRGLLDDLERSPFEFSGECRDEAGRRKGATARASERNGKVCWSVDFLADRKPARSDLVGLAYHEISHHFDDGTGDRKDADHERAKNLKALYRLYVARMSGARRIGCQIRCVAVPAMRGADIAFQIGEKTPFERMAFGVEWGRFATVTQPDGRVDRVFRSERWQGYPLVAVSGSVPSEIVVPSELAPNFLAGLHLLQISVASQVGELAPIPAPLRDLILSDEEVARWVNFGAYRPEYCAVQGYTSNPVTGELQTQTLFSEQDPLPAVQFKKVAMKTDSGKLLSEYPVATSYRVPSAAEAHAHAIQALESLREAGVCKLAP